MSFFPIYIDLKNLKILVVGGGHIASEKIEKLIPFTKKITIITSETSMEIHTLIRDHGLILHQRAYEKGDIEGFDLVVIATNTLELHKTIYEESRASRIFVNSVDSTKYCDFIFPAYVQKGDLTIAFSTGGASPAFTKKMRQYFEKNIPNSVAFFLEKMKSLRATMPKGKERMKYFDALVERYFSQHFK